MGQIENMTGKNMTFSSDSEEPNGVRFDKEFIFKVVAYDQGRRECSELRSLYWRK